MNFSELPPVYARLVGFVAGSLVQRAGSLVSEDCRQEAWQASKPVRKAASKVLPRSLQRGFELAVNQPGGEPPVLIVPGFLGPALLLLPLATFLRLNGRTVRQIVTFPALDGVKQHAQRIAEAVEQLKRDTAAPRVDLVTHSMGGLAARYYLLKMGGNAHVRRLVTIATPHRGTRWAHLGLGQSLKDMVPGNPLLEELAPEVPVPGVKCLNIRAGWDQIVWPREHGVWNEHARDTELPFAEHWAVQADVRLLALVLTELEAEDHEVMEGTVELGDQRTHDELGEAS